MEEQDPKPKVAVGCTGCLTLLCLLGLAGGLIAPIATSGKASWEEVMPGIISSSVCCFLSVLLLGGAIFWMVKSNQNAGM